MSMLEDNESSRPADDFAAVDKTCPVDATELPPVEPPSAGFIAQLFLVPGVIVLVVVAVWAMFGKLAAGQEDWKSLVVELGNNNQLRRTRAAHGLAVMLQADVKRGAEKQKLVNNPVIIDKLTNLLDAELGRKSHVQNDLNFQIFLTKSMALLDPDPKVIDVLERALQPGHDVGLRQTAIESVAILASRAAEDGSTFQHASLTARLIKVSADTEPAVRQLSAFALGLIQTPASDRRLRVMLDDPNTNTQLNAALGLTRRNSTAGLAVFEAVLKEAVEFDPQSISGSDEIERRKQISYLEYEQDLRLKNTLDALSSLAGVFTARQRTKLTGLVQDVSRRHRRQEFRFKADTVLQRLRRQK